MGNLSAISRKKKNISIDKIIKLHNAGLYDRQIAELCGCSRHNITQRLNRAGYVGRHGKAGDVDLGNRISTSLIGRYCGKDNPNFKGYTNEKVLARGIFKTISKRVMRKRDYTCEICGKRGGDLATHHIRPFSEIMNCFLDERYSGNIKDLYGQLTNYKPFMDEDNLIVVCKKCHKEIHSKDNHEPNPYLQGKVQRLSKSK